MGEVWIPPPTSLTRMPPEISCQDDEGSHCRQVCGETGLYEAETGVSHFWIVTLRGASSAGLQQQTYKVRYHEGNRVCPLFDT